MRKLILTAVTAATLAAPVAAVTAAHASTPGCSATAFCGSLQITPVDRNPLMMAVTNKPGIGTRVVVKLASATNPAEDFLQYAPPNPVGPANQDKVFRFAPNGFTYTGKGFKGGLCVTASSDAVRAAVVLEPCTNATGQQWIFTPEGASGSWRLRDSSYVLTDPNGQGAGTGLQIRNDWTGPNQNWLYVAGS
jgi:hypothetical protein